MAVRSKTTKNLFDKKEGRKVKINNDLLHEVIGEAEAKGCWLIYGAEKNGKTWFTLMLAKAIAANEKVNYISAEEGLEDSFKEAVKRAGITLLDKNILWDEYLSLEEIVEKHSKPKQPNILIIDNLTMYADEFKTMSLREFTKRLPNKLIIFLAHEERKEPYPASARMAKKLAKVYVNVKGLRASVVSRFSKGGDVDIDEEKAELYWGSRTN